MFEENFVQHVQKRAERTYLARASREGSRRKAALQHNPHDFHSAAIRAFVHGVQWATQ